MRATMRLSLLNLSLLNLSEKEEVERTFRIHANEESLKTMTIWYRVELSF